MFDILEAISFALWAYWRILRTGQYPSSSRPSKGR